MMTFNDNNNSGDYNDGEESVCRSIVAQRKGGEFI